MNIAVVGANGFIAKHLCKTLSQIEHVKLFLFGRGTENKTGIETSYSSINFNDKEKLKAQFQTIDLVYYLISDSIPSSSWQNPSIEVESNLIPFLNFMEVAASLKIKKVAFISSAGTVYGTTQGRVSEDFNKQPFSPYGIMKLCMENFLNYYHAKYAIQFDVYRVSNVYGEGQDTSRGLGIINTFLEKILSEQKVTVYGDGEATRNYIYVKDVVQLMLHSINNSNTSSTFNLSSQTTLSINKLIEIIKKIANQDFEIVKVEMRKSDNSFIDLDNSKILQFNPSFNFTSIEQGISTTFNFIKSKK